MATVLLLDEIKKALRIKATTFDDEIGALILEAKKDMEDSGIKNIVDENPTIRRAIKTYCKANFGLDNKDMEKYVASYKLQVDKMRSCSAYTVVPVVPPVQGV